MTDRIAPVIDFRAGRKRAEAQLERRVIERWTGPMDAERGWLREGLQQARDEAEADPSLLERVRNHPSGMTLTKNQQEKAKSPWTSRNGMPY